MSRTTRGEKGPGYDYWSRRHPSNGINGYGKDVKRMTHRHERREAKKELEELQEEVCPVCDEANCGGVHGYSSEVR